MRPLRLIMNAYGPYYDKVDLDFTKFGSSNLFLITGATGSGKTSIFDGITYALYNNASGGTRELDTMKSQFASDEDLCYVEFDFEIGTKRYRIYRSPKQKGPGKRKKSIQLDPTVEFYEEDNLLATGTEANHKITELMGLTYEQFKQIVLLPQGEFRKLLLSNSNEKEAIFRNIFGTENIQNFQDVLNSERKQLSEEANKYKNILDQALASINLSTEAEASALSVAIQTEDYEEIIQLLKGRLNDTNKELTQAKNQLVELGKKKSSNEVLLNLINEKETLEQEEAALAEQKDNNQKMLDALGLHEKANKINIEYEALSKIENTLAKITENLDEAKEKQTILENDKEVLEQKKQASDEAENKLDGIRETIKALELEQTQLEARDKNIQSLANQTAVLKNNHAEIKKLQVSNEIIKKDYDRVKLDLEKIPTWRAEEVKTKDELARAEDELAETKRKIEICERILAAQKQISLLLKESQVALTAKNTAEKRHEEARQHYFSNVAGILIDQLEEDKPCPVCGSVHHPDPAQRTMGEISDEQLLELEADKTAEIQAYTAISEKINHQEQSLKEAKTLLTEESADYAKTKESFETTQTDLANKIKELKMMAGTLHENINQEENWRQRLQDLQEQKNSNEISMAEKKSTVEKIDESIIELNKAIEQIEKNLQYESTQAINEEIVKRNNEIINITKNAKEIAEELNKTNNALASIAASIEAHTQQKQGQKREKDKQQKIFETLLADYQFTEDFKKYVLLEADEADYRKQTTAFKENVSLNKRQLETARAKIKSTQDTREKNEITAELETIKEQQIEIETQRDQLLQIATTVENSLQTIDTNYQKSKKILAPLTMYTELADLANGRKISGYVSFERYVLSIYFDEILLAANSRFEKMTNDRYELVRRTTPNKGQGSEGLDIDVFDRFSGRSRSVTSLSGGETFKASLALALGLSDVIQSQQGGVHVDTLFIDEGFGSLDEDSLETAIDTLVELQDTGRFIGIISHVNELKERLPARIVVEKAQQGSRARIEVE